MAIDIRSGRRKICLALTRKAMRKMRKKMKKVLTDI